MVHNGHCCTDRVEIASSWCISHCMQHLQTVIIITVQVNNTGMPIVNCYQAAVVSASAELCNLNNNNYYNIVSARFWLLRMQSASWFSGNHGSSGQIPGSAERISWADGKCAHRRALYREFTNRKKIWQICRFRWAFKS